ncbi:alcohol dehydrogenase catalytic domain-containing protein [Gordonia sp. HNM0687]|uniref:Alcohol dehydrogenase catalytic domain-containing protein n=1 Tax=Gordonia mangrovi TaxID=2665643 RepID=A0A6L7GV80_9ACTN|nr:NAD(P)-dependent alcohol dehydrogenase [Gordonia mangrovi]MXP23392.1 alcohol dehydrogenase catalytic domain-containing protein [Gordonia mangrovi]UVF76705.1 NAD(P)-dependent alcohol dehydrogenase [Gordonia mangrovi]
MPDNRVTARAAIATGDADQPFEIDEIELDDIRPDELLVRMVATGICHADISAATGVIPFDLPGVLGHEGVGVVEAVGAKVDTANVGDKVLLSFTSCGRCRHCRSGHPAYCESHLRLNLLGGRRDDGSATVRYKGADISAHFFGQSSFGERAVVDEKSVYVLPPNTTEEEMAILAPLGCGMLTGAGAVLNVLRPNHGSTIAIAGAGAVGMAAIMAMKFTPAAQVIAIDIIDSRLELARDLGATATINAAKEDVQQRLLELTDGEGITHGLETSGNVTALQALVESLAVAGELALIGAPPAGSRGSFEVQKHLPGKVIRGITMGDAEPQSFIATLIDAYRKGLFPMDRLQRHYKFDDIRTAIADAKSGVAIKPVLVY